MMYCAKCNAEFPDGMTYCKWCGGSLRPKAVATTQLHKCYSCASPIQPGWEFCNVCGARQTPAAQQPVSVSPLCMRCGAVVPPGVSNCLRCGERFTSERGSGTPSFTPAPIPADDRCTACGDILDKGAIYCKACGTPVTTGTIGFQRESVTPQQNQPAPPQGPQTPPPDETIDFSSRRRPPTPQPPPFNTNPDETMDFGNFRQPPAQQPPQPPPPGYQKTEIIHSAKEKAPPIESTIAFKSGRTTDESTSQKQGDAGEQPRTSSLETRVERPSMQKMVSPDLTTHPTREEPPAPSYDPFEISDTPTVNLSNESALPDAPPPPFSPQDVSTIQIGSGDWLAGSFAKENPPETPPAQPPAPQTVFEESQPTVINHLDQQAQPQGRPAEWQQAPTIEAPRYQPPVTQTPGGEAAPPMERRATPPYEQPLPPQPLPPSPFPPPAQTKKGGGLPIIPIAAVIVGLGIVAFLVYWFALRAKPINTNANISTTANTNTSVANSNTTVANSNTSTTSTTSVVPEGMVLVEAGKYNIGREDGDDIEKPKHEVTLKPFFIDKTEVTNADYKKFILATNHQPPSDWQNGSFAAGKDRFPVVNVTWKDANDYATWANKRLPTEEEWEAAARGTDGRKYPWGNDWNPANANIKAKGIVEVGKYPGGKSPSGALDMVGNVWEWTATKFALYPGNTDKPPEEASKNYRVIRGGAYDGDKKHDASYRGYVDANEKFDKTGFRCVKDAQ